MVASERATTENNLYLFTVDDFNKMAEVGILTASERVELINGVIWKMSPIGSLHASIVDRLARILIECLGNRAHIRSQNPIQLDVHDQLQPDFAILKPRQDDYEDNQPQASDVFVVIEVSDSTLHMDQTVKMRLYAVAGIPEYWIVDATGKQIEQYTQPTPDGYTQKAILKVGDTVRTAQFPDFSLSINQLFRIDTPNVE